MLNKSKPFLFGTTICTMFYAPFLLVLYGFPFWIPSVLSAVALFLCFSTRTGINICIWSCMVINTIALLVSFLIEPDIFVLLFFTYFILYVVFVFVPMVKGKFSQGKLSKVQATFMQHLWEIMYKFEKAGVYKSNFVSLQEDYIKLELFCALYVVADKALVKTHLDRVKIQQEIYALFLQKGAPTEAKNAFKEVFDDRTLFYNQIAAGKDLRGESLFFEDIDRYKDGELWERISVAFADVIVNCGCVDDYDNAPEVVNIFNYNPEFIKQNIIRPLVFELIKLYSDIENLS